MIYTKPNFFNNVAAIIDATFFPNVKYYRDCEKCTKVHYELELFNNGALTYRKLISRISKATNQKSKVIHNIVSAEIISFGNYKYTPSN